MRKYIVTEEQITRLLLEDKRPITKGIALHISDDQGDYYESKLMDFSSEEEYNEWKETLDEGMEIIGEMDIEEKKEPLQQMNESVDLKKKGFDVLTRLMKKEYPFIIELIPKDVEEGYDTYHSVDVVFDLNKFYDVTGTKPPEGYLKKHMLNLLEERGMYLRRYVSDENDKDYSVEYNIQFENLMNHLYQRLPSEMRITKFEGKSDEYFWRTVATNSKPEFYIKWRDEKEPIVLDLGYFYPQVDVDKL